MNALLLILGLYVVGFSGGWYLFKKFPGATFNGIPLLEDEKTK